MARARAPRPAPDVLYEDLCFDAQQAAEKAIKAVLVQRSVEFRRPIWTLSRLSSGRTLKATDVAEEFSVAVRTAYRDLDFLRDQWRAPVEYDHREQTYLLTEPTWSLRLVTLTRGEMFALFFAEKVLRQVPTRVGMNRTPLPSPAETARSDSAPTDDAELSQLPHGVHRGTVPSADASGRADVSGCAFATGSVCADSLR